MSTTKSKTQKKQQSNHAKCSFVPKKQSSKYYYITPPPKYKPSPQIDEFAVDSNVSTDSSLKAQKNDSPVRKYCPKEPSGELQVVLNGDVIQVISQSRAVWKQRKLSDQETYAMSGFITGPKSMDIPCPQFLKELIIQQ